MIVYHETRLATFAGQHVYYGLGQTFLQQQFSAPGEAVAEDAVTGGTSFKGRRAVIVPPRDPGNALTSAERARLAAFALVAIDVIDSDY